MRVRLILDSGIYVKEYPLAKDEEEARSMMFRDHNQQILKVVMEGGRVLFNVELIA